jgi:phosphoribosylformylglycinamidine (FGAM) synthase-like amidotransferase family enzyme
VSARVAVVLFPGTNSEDETQRALAAVGIDAEIVHWSRGAAGLRRFDAFVLPGGFSYEDRVRAGAVAAHDEVMDAVTEGARDGKFVIGICNGNRAVAPADGRLRTECERQISIDSRACEAGNRTGTAADFGRTRAGYRAAGMGIAW